MDLTDTLKALSDPTRREILAQLQESDLTAGAIAEAFDISKPSVSHHLNVLRQVGLVSAERDGQHIIYSLNTTVLQDVTRWFLDFTEASAEDEEPEPQGGPS